MGLTLDNILNLLQRNSAEIQSNEASEEYGATRLTLSVIFWFVSKIDLSNVSVKKCQWWYIIFFSTASRFFSSEIISNLKCFNLNWIFCSLTLGFVGFSYWFINWKVPLNRFRDEDRFFMCKSQLYHLYCKFNLQSKFQRKAKEILSNNRTSLIQGRFKNRYHILFFIMMRLFMYLYILYRQGMTHAAIQILIIFYLLKCLDIKKLFFWVQVLCQIHSRAPKSNT